MPSHEKDLTAEERWHVIIIFTLSVNVLELQRLMSILGRDLCHVTNKKGGDSGEEIFYHIVFVGVCFTGKWGYDLQMG